MSGLPSNFDDALKVIQHLRASGHTAYLAGGCVRDRLLGLTPTDHDVATDAPPDTVRSLFRRTQAVGAAFGVVLVHVGSSVIEVATFRADGTYEDGRRPGSVRFTNAREDALRRDFTINALFYDPIADQIIDFVGGRDDLSARILRAVGTPHERFEEDQLRLLRAVRFAARFGLTIEPATAAAIRRCAPKLPRISPERIADELRRTWTPPTRAAAMKLLRDLHLSRQIFRSLDAPDSNPGGLFEHLSPHAEVSFGLALAAAILDEQLELAPPQNPANLTNLQLASLNLTERSAEASTAAMRRTLRLSNDETDRCLSILTWTSRLLSIPKHSTAPSVALLKRMLASPAGSDTLQLLSALASANLCGPTHDAQHLNTILQRCSLLATEDCAPTPFISGDDLAALGLPPGPRYKQILADLYDAQLEHRITTRPEALQAALAAARTRSNLPPANL